VGFGSARQIFSKNYLRRIEVEDADGRYRGSEERGHQADDAGHHGRETYPGETPHKDWQQLYAAAEIRGL
jgi:hypothetical protein